MMFQSDAFYYLDIARNSAGRRGYMFDGVHPTNGFHPLWQYLLSFCQWLGLFDLTDPTRALPRVFLLNVVLLAAGAGLFTYFIAKQVRSPYLALLATAPGFLWFAVCPLNQGYLSTWSYANGLESALSLALMASAVCLWPVGNSSTTRQAAFSVMLGLAILTRLDDVFFLMAVLWTGWFSMKLPFRKLLLWVCPAFLLIASYLLYNKATVGVFLPTSGAAKAGLGLRTNLGWTLKLIIPMFTKRLPRILTSDGESDAFQEEAFRAFQMVVPMLICTMYLVMRRGRRHSQDILATLAVGVILKGLYNWVFVAGGYQGSWYYTVSVMVANAIAVVWCDQLFQYVPITARIRRVFACGYGVLVLYALSAFYGIVSQEWGPARLRLLNDGKVIAANLAKRDDHCFIEFDDGFVSFALAIQAESGFGLALDVPATKALRDGDFVPVMEQRGCLLAATFGYTSANQAYISKESWKTGKPLWGISSTEFGKYTLVPAGSIPEDSLSFFRFKRVRQIGREREKHE